MDKHSQVGGLIAYYQLQEWWLTAFTLDEQEYIDSRYQPMGAPPHTLTQGEIMEMTLTAPEFLNSLNSWFRAKNDESIADRIHRKLGELAREQPVDAPGYLDGRHFTTYVRDFEILKKEGNVAELEKLLLQLVEATEAECVADGTGVAPAYYSELAILYRKQKEFEKEAAILERFANQTHAPGVMPAKLLNRLIKARELLAKSTRS